MLNGETWQGTWKAEARDHEARLAESREKRDLVMSKIREGYFQAKGASSSAEFGEADALLAEALAWMKNGWDGFNTVTQLISSALSTGIMTQEDRDECWAEWKEVQKLLRLRRDEFYAEARAQRVSQWRCWIEQNENRMEALQAQVDRYEELERSARTEEFAQRMRERIEEKIQTISRLERRNQELEMKLADAASSSY
jgi:hypothetical protein